MASETIVSVAYFEGAIQGLEGELADTITYLNKTRERSYEVQSRVIQMRSLLEQYRILMDKEGNNHE